MENIQYGDIYLQLKLLCSNIVENPKSCSDKMKHLEHLIPQIPTPMLQKMLSTVLCVAYPVFKTISEDALSYKEQEKQQFINTFKLIFDRAKIDKPGLFYNFYTFLLLEVYDPVQHKVKSISEEYKLSIMQCMVSLCKALSWDVLLNVYAKNSAPKLCQMLYVALEMAKNEQYKKLRITAMECIMCLARVSDEMDASDAELKCNVADIFMFFLPGIAVGLKAIILEDQKTGYKVITTALETWCKIVMLLAEDHNNVLSNTAEPEHTPQSLKTTKWNNKADIEQYLNETRRTREWYRETDKKLYEGFVKFYGLTQHPHQKIRLELAHTCSSLIETSMKTMPACVGEAVIMLIALSEDELEEISLVSKSVLNRISGSFSSNEFKSLLENLEESFYNTINTLPRTFNRKDSKQQILALNLVIGYINVFGEHKLNHILHSPAFLSQLFRTLLHISEIEKTEIQSLEEINTIELDSNIFRTPWKRFYYFNDDVIRNKLENVCSLFCKFGALDIVSDFLLDSFTNSSEQKCEATYLLNELFSDTTINGDYTHVVKNILETYLDPCNWNVPLKVMENKHSLAEVRRNIVQVCFQTDGVGKLALVLKSDYQQFLLKSLYLILERAGSRTSLIRLAGLKALNNIIEACGYQNVTNLIQINSDYFSYHVVRKLNKFEQNESVLNVLAVVMNYSTVDVLPSFTNIVDVALMQSCDKYKQEHADAYLRIFNIFIKSLHRWFEIKVEIEPVKSKLQKEKEFEDFKISNKFEDNNDFSDSIMGKTAEEMYQEDLKKTKEELLEPEIDEVEEYKKPEPPLHINITVSILKRSLHFLPSKDKQRKLIVLEILRGGLEVIKDWEDELLPIVHQIWSPLIGRFKEHTEPLIINLSFQLLTVLARLSKDFIRSRTAKDVLPSIKEVLTKLSKESYLKDRGASYRYTQSYKLQLTILQNLANILANLDMSDADIQSTIDCVFPYMDNKQPIPLQDAAYDFFKTLIIYDPPLVKRKLIEIQGSKLYQQKNASYDKNISRVLNKLQG